MTAAALVRELEAAGGTLRLVGGEVKATIPPGAAGLLSQLREHKAEIIELLAHGQPRPSDMAEVELLPDEVRQWDDAMRAWTQARCAWLEHGCGSISALYVDQIAWAHRTGGLFAPDIQTFRAILMALGFTLSPDGSTVYGLIFKADAEAIAHATSPANQPPAARWLKAFLASGAKPVSECDAAGRSAGFTRRQIFDGADDLRLDRVRIGERLCWKLSSYLEAQ